MEKQTFKLDGKIKFAVSIEVKATNISEAKMIAKRLLKNEYSLDVHGMSHEVGSESIDVKESLT